MERRAQRLEGGRTLPHISTTVRSVGVDTLTASAGGEDRLPYLQSLGCYLLMRSAQQGNRVAYFKRGPYQGGQTRDVGYAEHHGRGLVELRGEVARDWGLLLLPWTDKVSRIDLQVTVNQEPYWDDMAYCAWLDAKDKARIEGRPAHYTLYADATKGHTLYIGRRASRFQARLYEKGKEDGAAEWENCWRYEVQARRERAQQVAGELGGASQPEAEITRLVHSHFNARGVVPIYHPSEPYQLAPLPPECTDSARSLKWLGSSVAPVVERLYSTGDYDAALRALGIGRTLEHP